MNKASPTNQILKPETTGLKALVIGATGLVGSQLVNLLLTDSRFDEVIVFTRRKTGLNHARLSERLVDFEKRNEWASELQGDVLFSALGTTLKTAGNKEKQYLVDFTYQYETAKAAVRNGVSNYVLVSSSGANSKSKLFYTRMKGELDDAVLKLNFRKTTILRPSFLDGNRPEKRTAEKVALKLARPITRVIFKKYRPIMDQVVAQAMINAVFRDTEKKIFTLDEIFELAT